MYINKNKHILSNTIMAVAVINTISEGLNTIVRKHFSSEISLTPQLLNEDIWRMQLAISFLQLILVCVVFYISRQKMMRYKRLIPEEDMSEMAKLQEEIIPQKISFLNLKSSFQLLQIWASILIGVEIVYNVTSIAYRNFIYQLSMLFDFSNPAIYQAFIALYNNTHGFKYVGMLIAICLGILTTGVFLKDRKLVISSGLMITVFLIAFLFVHMKSVFFLQSTGGIVWTSVIFHLIETCGLLIISFYLRISNKGI